jgi:hypothetical protein
MIRLAVVAVSVAYAAAQAISADCMTALSKVGTDPGAVQCLALGAFVPVLTAAGSGTSLVPSLNDWFNSMCGSPSCNDGTLAAIATDITSGCSAELTSLGLPTDAATLTKGIEAVYPTFRNIACLRDANMNCVIELLTAIESAEGKPLTPGDIISLFITPPHADAPASIVCTNCNKEIYNLLSKVLKTPDIKNSLQSICGASFVDGSNPPGVTESASTAVVTGT